MDGRSQALKIWKRQLSSIEGWQEEQTLHKWCRSLSSLGGGVWSTDRGQEEWPGHPMARWRTPQPALWMKGWWLSDHRSVHVYVENHQDIPSHEVRLALQCGPKVKIQHLTLLFLWSSRLMDNVFVLGSMMAPAAFAVVGTERQVQMWV